MNPGPAKSESFEERQLSILKIQYGEIGTTFRTVWDFYLKFYIAFLTLNFTALGLVIKYMDRADRWPLVLSFVVQNLLSAATGFGIGTYSRHAARHQQASINAYLTKDRRGSAHQLEFKSPIPARLASWSALANATSQFLFIGCWFATLHVGKVKSP